MTVTLTVTVTDSSGNETVTTHDFETAGGTAPLVGDVSGTFGDCFVAGDLNLTGDLFIEGLMTGVDTFTVEGNGFSMFFQNGGRADLHGKFKAAWGQWGTDSTGWSVGDRIAVAPTKVGVYAPSELLWVGGWSSMPRPSTSLDVTLVDGTIARPEVANLSQSIVFKNLSRGFHFHDSAEVQNLSDVKFLNCGTTGVLGHYPVHFHLLGDNSRGSVLERVVVEGGKNHAFVPHASHGVTFRGCAAVNTIDDPYWWDPPPVGTTDEINFTHDVDYDGCLALHVTHSSAATGARLAGFFLDGGSGNKCNRCTAVAIGGNAGFQNASGFHWPERGGGVWEFLDNVAHNNKIDGIFTWQNSPFFDHVIDRFTAYHCGKAGVEHGAYLNFYAYRNLVLSQNLWGMFNHALSSKTPDADQLGAFLVFEDVLSDTPLRIANHNAESTRPVFYRRCTFPRVVYGEQAHHESWIVYEDCGLIPSDFDLTGVRPESRIEIFEAGVLVHRWFAGSWS